jgi:hypothetical protein
MLVLVLVLVLLLLLPLPALGKVATMAGCLIEVTLSAAVRGGALWEDLSTV